MVNMDPFTVVSIFFSSNFLYAQYTSDNPYISLYSPYDPHIMPYKVPFKPKLMLPAAGVPRCIYGDPGESSFALVVVVKICGSCRCAVRSVVVLVSTVTKLERILILGLGGTIIRLVVPVS